MVSINIDGRYSVTGTNSGVVYCNSADQKPTGPPMRNGYELYELDTKKIYLYDEAISGWRYWKTAGEGGGGGGGDVTFATNAEAQEVLDGVFKNRNRAGVIVADMTKATTLEQFAMLANEAADYTDERVVYAIEKSQEKAGYTHTQATASAQWNVTHNLGRYPAVSVVDSAGSKVVGDVRYTSLNSVTITFSAPFSGYAYFS